ncbi:MAG: hypothetical protein D6730_06340 [Bacteroidetes bacterium]|nr:MAG: hypothetical protein D6730_06340 [Bacteroidota bacterium]
MEIVDVIAEVLKYVAPAALLLLAIKYMNDAQLEKEKAGLQAQVRLEVIRQHLPLKLTAYERAVLFLERINPASLLPRCGNGLDRSARQFHAELLQEIRSEFEHNLSQQIYISHQGWLLLVQAKEEILSLINMAARELEEDAQGLELSKKIIEKISQLKSMPTHKATFVLKSDVHKLFEN